MDVDESLKLFGMTPSEEQLPRIREMLEQEADKERHGRERTEDLALLCCVQLFSRGQLEDVLRIWAAKRSGFDLASYLEVQLLCGAGLEETKQFLSRQTDPEAGKALTYLTKCEQAGDFTGFSPAAFLNTYRNYFGVK
jgi:hypothetical protein